MDEDDLAYFYNYRCPDEDGRDVYLCIDCGCNEEEPITDLNAHEQWHADHPHAGKRQTVADLAELYGDDEYWSQAAEREPQEQLTAGPPLAAVDAAWSQTFTHATGWLDHRDRPTGTGVEFVGIQRFVPCARRGAHLSLSECPTCHADVLCGAARPEDVLTDGRPV
jgi:hypothetical protein